MFNALTVRELGYGWALRGAESRGWTGAAENAELVVPRFAAWLSRRWLVVSS
jgi:hypothetical protein